MCEICSKLTNKSPEQCQWLWTDLTHCPGVSIDEFEQINADWDLDVTFTLLSFTNTDFLLVCFPAFGLNTGKYGPGKTPYLETFHSGNIIHFSVIFSSYRLNRWLIQQNVIKFTKTRSIIAIFTLMSLPASLKIVTPLSCMRISSLQHIFCLNQMHNQDRHNLHLR